MLTGRDMLVYQQGYVRQEIAAIPVRLRVAFAAACAQRLTAVFIAAAQRTGVHAAHSRQLAETLELIWTDLLLDRHDKEGMRGLLPTCMAIVEELNDGAPMPGLLFAEDEAASAVVYALRAFVDGDAQDAAWAAERAYEAADRIATALLAMEQGAKADDLMILQPAGPDANARLLYVDPARIREHPVVQAEINAQYRDLEQVRSVEKDQVGVIQGLRDRAVADNHLSSGISTR